MEDVKSECDSRPHSRKYLFRSWATIYITIVTVSYSSHGIPKTMSRHEIQPELETSQCSMPERQFGRSSAWGYRWQVQIRFLGFASNLHAVFRWRTTQFIALLLQMECWCWKKGIDQTEWLLKHCLFHLLRLFVNADASIHGSWTTSITSWTKIQLWELIRHSHFLSCFGFVLCSS